MKLGKRKSTGIIAISLAAVALTSVGFAAWTIDASDIKDEGNNVKVTTGGFEDKRFTFTAEIDSTDNSVAFDSVEGEGKIHGDAKKEDLTFKVKANIKGSNLTTSVDGIYIYFVDTDSKYAGMISDGLIQSPIPFGSGSEVEIIDGAALVVGEQPVDGGKYDDPSSVSKYTYQITKGTDSTESSLSLDIAFTFTFAWGSAFDCKNPTEAINSPSPGYDADTMIGKLKTLTSNYANPKLQVVVTAKAKTASA